MKKVYLLACLVLAVFVLNACQTTDLDLKAVITLPTEVSVDVPLRTSPVDVVGNFILPQAIAPQAVTVADGNLFDNGGFESGLNGWTGCAAGAIESSTEAYEGAKALKVNAGNCFYRSAEVSAGQDLVLSCYVRLQSGSAWTGMGMGFANESWTTIGNAPTTVITGSSYARYDVKATAPAGSKYASMWLYTDNPTLVDNCSLMLETTTPPPPPPATGENLLENGGFGFRDFSQTPTRPRDWTIGCGGEVNITNGVINRLGRGIVMRGGACVDQGLSASDIAEISGQTFTFSCLARNNQGYAALSVFLDGQPISKAIPVSEYYQLVELQATAEQVSNGFVSIYSEGNLVLDECGLARGAEGFEQKPAVEIRNGRPGTETVDSSEPIDVLVQVKNSGNVLLTSLNASSDTLDCSVNSSNVQPGQIVNFNCTTVVPAAGETLTSIVSATGTTASGLTASFSDGFKQINTGSIPVDTDLLENGNFSTLDANNKPTNWNLGCGGTWNMTNFQDTSLSVPQIYDGGCVDQALSAEEVSALSGKDFTLSCNLNQTGGYASMSVFLDGVPVSKTIPVTTQADGIEFIKLTGTAGQISSAFVSFYSEGTADNNLKLLLCSFEITN